MGASMAARLIAAGHEVLLNTRSQVPADLMTGQAMACDSAKEVVEKADTIFLMLPDMPDVAKVLCGDQGVAGGLRLGKTIVDMSSISPNGHQACSRKTAPPSRSGWWCLTHSGSVRHHCVLDSTAFAGSPKVIGHRVKQGRRQRQPVRRFCR